MADKELIMKRLREDFDLLTKKHGFEVFGVFLQGSQNYGLDDEYSDIDTRAIIIPCFEDFSLNRTPVSTTLILPSDEHIDVKDIREMFKLFRKQNLQFVEILFTDYFVVNAHYIDLWERLVASREAIARYNNYASVNCIAGASGEKVHALTHPYPSKVHLIEEYGYDGKQLHHILRLNQLMRKYTAGVPYADCIKADDIDELMRHKRPPFPLPLNRAQELAMITHQDTKYMKDEYMAGTLCEVKKYVEQELDSIMIEALKRKFKEDING